MSDITFDLGGEVGDDITFDLGGPEGGGGSGPDLSDALPVAPGATAGAGTDDAAARGDHRHPHQAAAGVPADPAAAPALASATVQASFIAAAEAFGVPTDYATAVSYALPGFVSAAGATVAEQLSNAGGLAVFGAVGAAKASLLEQTAGAFRAALMIAEATACAETPTAYVRCGDDYSEFWRTTSHIASPTEVLMVETWTRSWTGTGEIDYQEHLSESIDGGEGGIDRFEFADVLQGLYDGPTPYFHAESFAELTAAGGTEEWWNENTAYSATNQINYPGVPTRVWNRKRWVVDLVAKRITYLIEAKVAWDWQDATDGSTWATLGTFDHPDGDSIHAAVDPHTWIGRGGGLFDVARVRAWGDDRTLLLDFDPSTVSAGATSIPDGALASPWARVGSNVVVKPAIPEDPHGDRAYSVQRANHTGTQAQSTITDLVSDLAGKQPLDSDLTALAALTTTSFGRALLELANAGALRTAAGLVIGTDVQAYDSDLAAIAALTTTSWGRALLALADAAAARTAIGVVTPTSALILPGLQRPHVLGGSTTWTPTQSAVLGSAYATLGPGSAANDISATWRVALDAGTYSVRPIARRSATGAQMGITLGGVAVTTSFDTYNASNAGDYAPTIYTGIVLAAPGVHDLVITNPGRNASNTTGYSLTPQAFDIWRTSP